MDNMDSYLGKRIKGCAARVPMPAGGRSRLLKAAAQTTSDAKRDFDQRITCERYHRPRHLMRSMVDWEIINPFNSSVMMMRVLL